MQSTVGAVVGLLSIGAAACAVTPAVPAKKERPPTMGSGGSPGVDIFATPEQCETSTAPAVGHTPLRRVSRIEYNNMVRDLFGDASRPADKFVAEEKVLNFNANVVTPPTELNAEQYFGAAESLSSCIVTGEPAGKCGATFEALSSCASTADAACVEPFLSGLARRAFRGSLPADEEARLLAVYRDGAAGIDADAGVILALQAILLSPRFLFVVEFGDESSSAAAVPLTPHEVAGRLAFALWRSVPDGELLTAAGSGQLASVEQIRAQAERMLNDAKAEPMLQDFVEQWLGIEKLSSVVIGKDPALYPEWTGGDWNTLREEMRAETKTFFSLAVRNQGGTLPNVLNLDSTFGASPELVKFYGAAPDPANPSRHVLPANRRGILMHASVLAAQSHPTKASPVFRGKLIREQILCQTLPLPDPDVDMNVPDPQTGETTRDRFEAHSSLPDCAGCHSLMDPIGFGFGHFNSLGIYKPQENGVDVDASGEIIAASSGVDGPFSGARELIDRLAQSEHVAQCYALQNLRYALGRAESSADTCSAFSAYEAFKASSFDLTDLIVAIASSDAFRHRDRVTPGGACR